MSVKQIFSKDTLLKQLSEDRTAVLNSILEADKPLHERKGHILQKHLGMTTETMLNRLLMEMRPAISVFPSLDFLYRAIDETLRKNIADVVRVQNGELSGRTIQDVLSQPTAFLYIKSDLREYATPLITLRIRHDPNSQYGMYAETMYAREPVNAVEEQYVKPTGRFFKNKDIFYGIGINRDINAQIRWYLQHEKHLSVKQITTGDLYVDIHKRRHHFEVLISDGEIKKYIRTIPGVSVRTSDSVKTDDSDRRSLQLLKEFRKECPELQQIKEDVAEFVHSLKAHERGYGGMSLHKVEISVDQEQYQNYMREVLRAKGELELPIYNGFDRDRKLYLFEQPVILNGIIHASIDDIANPEARAIAEEYCAILFSDDSLNDDTPFLGNGNELQGIPPDMYDEIMMEYNRALIQQEENISEQDQDLYQSSHVHISRSDGIDLGDER